MYGHKNYGRKIVDKYKKKYMKKDVDMDRYKNIKKSFKKFHGCVFVDNILIFSIIYKKVDMDT